MNFAGLFRVVLWIAPVLAFIFLYISQQQQEQKAEMKVETAEFDKEFAAMNKAMSLDSSEKAFWSEEMKKHAKTEDTAKQRAKVENRKSDKMIEEVEKELNQTDFSKIKTNIDISKKGD